MDSTTGQDAAVSLPEGWRPSLADPARVFVAAYSDTGPDVYADTTAEAVSLGDVVFTPAEARQTAARLLQAAALVDGCTCAVAYPSAGWEMRVLNGTCPTHTRPGAA